MLYLSYTGMMEALGASQVLNYLYGLSVDFNFHLVSFEKENDYNDLTKREDLNKKLMQHNIKWYPFTYKKGFTGYINNLYQTYKISHTIIKNEKISLIHCRSFRITLVAFFLKKIHKNIKYIYDTRAFWLDERADIGRLNKNGLLYKLAKKIDKQLYLQAAHITILSEKGKETIQNNELFEGGNKLKNITVIPTCVDLSRFNMKDILEERKNLTIGYIGNAKSWYDFDFTLQVLSAIMQKVDYKLLIFNGEDNGTQHEYIKQKLSEYNLTNFSIEKVSFNDMPKRLKEIDISVFFIKPLFSKRASAATKLGELLATGIPVITNAGVGDHEYYIEQHSVGKIMDKDKILSYDFEKIISELNTNECRVRCREVAEKYFSLSNGVKRYKNIYLGFSNFK